LEAVRLRAAVVELDAQRRAVPGMTIDALVGQVQPLAIAVEQLPERLPAEGAQHVGIAANVEQIRPLKSRRAAQAGPPSPIPTLSSRRAGSPRAARDARRPRGPCRTRCPGTTSCRRSGCAGA